MAKKVAYDFLLANNSMRLLIKALHNVLKKVAGKIILARLITIPRLIFQYLLLI